MENTDGGRPKPQYPIETVDKALHLLLLFRDRSELRLSDVPGALEIGKSRAHRLLAMLVYHGFVIQDPASRTYRTGPALVELGLATVARMDVRAMARPVLEELAAATGETVRLGVLEEGNVRFVDGVESELALRVSHRVGRVLPAYATSLGRAMLAQLPTETLFAWYRDEALPPVTAQTIRRRSELLVELEAVRERGYAVGRGESEEGVSSLAVAASAAGPWPLMAISVAAPEVRLDEAKFERIADVLREVVKRLASSSPELRPMPRRVSRPQGRRQPGSESS
ncbi:IclR family transcriptional regulator [Streptomyces krungchingensis]